MSYRNSLTEQAQQTLPQNNFKLIKVRTGRDLSVFNIIAKQLY